jgi:hypothetical protein
LNGGFRKIFVVGVDHSWHENLTVGTDNTLYWRYDHFFDSAQQPLRPVYANPQETRVFRMHEILEALSHMFRAYVELEVYSRTLGARIYNASEKSYIDAFERMPLPE